MNQSAVEWLVENLIPKPNWVQRKVINQAKEMEKEQIKNAYEKGKKYKKPIKDSNPIWLNSKPYKDKIKDKVNNYRNNFKSE
jgi:hypothetical protein